jgi:DNA repair ATPase RecN
MKSCALLVLLCLFLAPVTSWGLTPAEGVIVDELESTLIASQSKIERLTGSTLSLSEKLRLSRESSKALELRGSSALSKIDDLESSSRELQEIVKLLSARYEALMEIYAELAAYCESLERQIQRQQTAIKIGVGMLIISIVVNVAQAIF